MRSFTIFLLTLCLLTLAAPAAHAFRLLGIGRPSAMQRHKYAYMLSGRRVVRQHATHHKQ